VASAYDTVQLVFGRLVLGLGVGFATQVGADVIYTGNGFDVGTAASMSLSPLPWSLQLEGGACTGAGVWGG